MSVQIEKRRYDCSALPRGWKREEVLRRTGLTCGKVDVYYYSPSGKKFRSKPQLTRYLGDTVDLSSFDFRTGKVNPMLARKNKKPRGTLFDYSRGMRNDASLVPPIRQTASIFKQPVTVIKTQPSSKVKADMKHGSQDKPKQLFWEKRLQGLQALDAQTSVLRNVDLPAALKAVGPNVEDQTVLQSVATALHIFPGPITGQTEAQHYLEKNPGVFLNPTQPLVISVQIENEDIARQEERVGIARHQLEKALRDLQP
ncbi:methyl-CpG-binding domain protein 2-like [Eriocheir sinensis]|uniref:methyl-CpG-binding domain protein 2-like n=1 Tax=Eriocheir sinensis TaxID=95602 RepID=UPI0021C7382A|nr:methyl-CpG-binding domain protein 2-like [Eriocheir sinensis]